MALRDMVHAAKKTTAQMNKQGSANSIIDATGNAPIVAKPAVAKQDISYKDSEIQGFVPQQRAFGSRQNFDSRHGSIIRNIASESNASSQMEGGMVSWEECKHKKTSWGKDFCSEYHCYCVKDKCNRVRK